MKLLPLSHIDCNQLVGALVNNENGGQFLITAVTISLDDFSTWISLYDLDQHASVGRVVINSSLSEWEIQLGNHSNTTLGL